MDTGPAFSVARRLVDPLLAVVFPADCPSCAEPVASPLAGPLCEPCWGRLPRHAGPACPCGTPLPEGGAGPCGRCRRGASAWRLGASLGPFDGPLRDAIHALKYRGRTRAAGRLAGLLLERPEVLAVLSGGELLVPVPLHPRRREQRGFNQSELLAQALAGASGLPVARRALVRRTDTPAQTGLSAAARRRNVAGAFAVRRRAEVDGRVAVLLDDVLTTGATARECARALLRAGATEVRLLTLARAL
ncbi:MAG: ComF family protein [Vicinamibacteria bacterium]